MERKMLIGLFQASHKTSTYHARTYARFKTPTLNSGRGTTLYFINDKLLWDVSPSSLVEIYRHYMNVVVPQP